MLPPFLPPILSYLLICFDFFALVRLLFFWCLSLIVCFCFMFFVLCHFFLLLLLLLLLLIFLLVLLCKTKDIRIIVERERKKKMNLPFVGSFNFLATFCFVGAIVFSVSYMNRLKREPLSSLFPPSSPLSPLSLPYLQRIFFSLHNLPFCNAII